MTSIPTIQLDEVDTIQQQEENEDNFPFIQERRSTIHDLTINNDEIDENDDFLTTRRQSLPSINSSTNLLLYKSDSNQSINKLTTSFHHRRNNTSLNHFDNIKAKQTKLIEIENDVKKIEFDVKCFVGNVKNLQYFSLNELLIYCKLRLYGFNCVGNELRTKRKHILQYIESVQDFLNSYIDDIDM